MPRRAIIACLIVAAVAPLAGCGQKGPLTLPPTKPAVAAPATPAPAPATTAARPAATAPATATSAG